MRYWYPADDEETGRAVEVLQALRRFHAADFDMRQRLRTDMDMNETDLRALRHLIRAEQAGESIGPTDLTRLLGVSSAATAKLLARMVASGHIRRVPNPSDHRAQHLYATHAAHHEVRATLNAMHARMLGVAESLTPAEQTTVIRFLDLLSATVGVPPEVAGPRALLPAVPIGPESPNRKESDHGPSN
ncbi:MarR family winged helix-turn-helix transcriptional regulator [Glaciibacter sp. 2TAF33]|uniref:MarR family winged helix-turn-helix transcriptional regulator n=1 Tax=Glaciibacter sp. 2TAF33 TaxID=3233015 RepID=UPI003F93E87F